MLRYLVITVFLSGCMADRPVHRSQKSEQETRSLNEPTFVEVDAKIFSSCATCHKSMSDRAAIVANIAEIRDEILGNTMPVDDMDISQPLSDELKKLLMEWIEAGMP